MSQPNPQSEYQERFEELKKQYPDKTDEEIAEYIENES